MIRMTVKLSGTGASLYELVERRIRLVRFVQESEDYDAIITDEPDTAGTAATSGKHVLLAGKNVQAIQKTAELCQRAGTLFMPAFWWRFLPSVRALHKSLKSGKLGDPGLLRIHLWEHAPDQIASAQDRILSEIDIANWIFKTRPTTIYAVSHDVSDRSYLQIHFGFPGDGMAIIDYSRCLPEDGSYYSLSLIGSNGAAYADDHQNMQLLYVGRDPIALKTEQNLDHLCAQVQEFTDSISTKRTPSVTVDDACTSIQVADAVIRSADLKQVATRTDNHYEFA